MATTTRRSRGTSPEPEPRRPLRRRVREHAGEVGWLGMLRSAVLHPPHAEPPGDLRPAGERRHAIAGRASLAGRVHPDRPVRQVGPAGRVLVIGAICFGLWALLAAPTLRASAESSPLGARRSAALAVLAPLQRVSEFLSLDRIGEEVDRALGRPVPVSPVELPPPPAVGPTPAPSSPVAAPTPTAAGGMPVDLIIPTPGPAHPATVLVVGDSIGGDLAQGMARLLDGRPGFRSRLDTRESTGLARPDYFNWTNQIALDLRRYRPGIVVAMFGGNDNQSFLAGGHGYVFGSAAWKEIYAARVGRIMDLVNSRHAGLVWVGMPIMQDSARSAQMRVLNGIFRAEAARRPGVRYVDAYRLFTDAKGRYSPFLPNAGGQQQLVRESDGIHLTIGAGGTRLAEAAFDAMTVFWTTPKPSPSAAGATSPSPGRKLGAAVAAIELGYERAT